MGRIAVLIPSRDRPAKLAQAIQSVRETSRAADVLVYADDDQRDLYRDIEDAELAKTDGRVIMHYGSQVGPVASANALVEANPGYAVYGLITDGMQIATVGWDRWLMARVANGRVSVASPAHSIGPHDDMPFVSAEWVRRLGWFAYPGCYHTGWPTITAVVAEAAGVLTRAGRHEFFVRHEMSPSSNKDWLREDARQLYAFFQHRFSTALAFVGGAAP